MAAVVAATMGRVLEEVELEITNFEEEYEGEWWRVQKKVEMMRRTSEEREKKSDQWVEYYVVTTARVSLVISDRAVREIRADAFRDCVNLWKIKAPFVEEVGKSAFWSCRNLVEVVLPNVNTVNEHAFLACPSLRKVALPSVRSIVRNAFAICYDLRHITLHPPPSSSRT